MGIFYDAVKRAVGAEIAEPTVPVEALEDLIVASSRKEPEEPVASTPPAKKTTSKSIKTNRKRLNIGAPLEKLMTLMSPSMLEENIQAVEQCRVLRTRLWESLQANNIRTLMVTSAMAEDGKTLLSINLAFGLSQLEGVRVLLIDADLRKPGVATFLNVECEQGLDSVVLQRATFDDVCLEVAPNLDIVLSTPAGDRSTDLVHSFAMQNLLERVSKQYDVVLLDTAPLFPVADTQALLPLIDGALLAVRAHRTRYELASEAAGLLKTKLIGTVLNGGERESHQDYRYSQHSLQSK